MGRLSILGETPHRTRARARISCPGTLGSFPSHRSIGLHIFYKHLMCGCAAVEEVNQCKGDSGAMFHNSCTICRFGISSNLKASYRLGRPYCGLNLSNAVLYVFIAFRLPHRSPNLQIKYMIYRRYFDLETFSSLDNPYSRSVDALLLL